MKIKLSRWNRQTNHSDILLLKFAIKSFQKLKLWFYIASSPDKEFMHIDSNTTIYNFLMLKISLFKFQNPHILSYFFWIDNFVTYQKFSSLGPCTLSRSKTHFICTKMIEQFLGFLSFCDAYYTLILNIIIHTSL